MLLTYQYDWYEDVTRIGEGQIERFTYPGEIPIKDIHEKFDQIVIEVIKVTPPAWPALPNEET
jgi:hypothetical protein